MATETQFNINVELRSINHYCQNGAYMHGSMPVKANMVAVVTGERNDFIMLGYFCSQECAEDWYNNRSNAGGLLKHHIRVL